MITGDVMTGSIANEILRQLSELHQKIDDAETNLCNKVDDVKDEIGGNGGVRERITRLEIVAKDALDKANQAHSALQGISKSPALSTYPPPKKKSAVKEHATAFGAGAGGTTVILGVIELIKMFLSTKH